MKLTQQAIKDFQKAYEEDFGEKISEAKAEEMGIELIELFRIIYRPIPNEENRQKTVDPDGSGR